MNIIAANVMEKKVGKQIGEAIGEARGKELGKELARVEAKRNIMKSLDCTADKAMDILQIEDEDRALLKDKI